jgi:hypothetical protein
MLLNFGISLAFSPAGSWSWTTAPRIAFARGLAASGAVLPTLAMGVTLGHFFCGHLGACASQ